MFLFKLVCLAQLVVAVACPLRVQGPDHVLLPCFVMLVGRADVRPALQLLNKMLESDPVDPKQYAGGWGGVATAVLVCTNIYKVIVGRWR